jgi:MarR family transcriptional regulator for hemolysin
MAATDQQIGQLLHGAARAWRNKLDERLRPLGLSQAKWRTLNFLSKNDGKLTQRDLARMIGIEEPTLVGLLHRLEREGWVRRRNAAHDRRCKTVHLRPHSSSVLAKIHQAAGTLRDELVAEISPNELRTCMKVLAQIGAKAGIESASLGKRTRTKTNGANGKRVSR